MTRLELKIYNILSDYLEFDLQEIFNCGDPIIFGGAIRDIISNQQINDIDIICTGQTYSNIINLLRSKLYFHKENLDLFHDDIYDDLEFTVDFFIKKENIIINLINPIISKLIKFNSLSELNTDNIYKALLNFTSEVDLSCCGICFTHNKKLKETYIGAIQHCINKEFKVLKTNKMYQMNRIQERINKMINRGWKNIL